MSSPSGAPGSCVRGSLLAGGGGRRGVKDAGERVGADRREVQQRHLDAWQAAEPGGQRGERVALARGEREGGVVVAVGGVEHAVEREHLVAHAGLGQLTAGALGLGQRRLLGAADEHERRDLWVAERADAGGVEVALVLQAGQRPQARRAGSVGVDEAGPRGWQREQAQRVARGRGVEDDVVIAGGRLGVSEQPGEDVEGGDLHRARARQALLHAGDGRVRKQPAVGADGALAVLARRGLGVDVRGVKAGDAGHRTRLLVERGAQHLVEVGRRVGGHDQHASAAADERDGGRAGQRGLAHASLAGEEQDACRRIQQSGEGAHQQVPPPPQQPPEPDAGAAIVRLARRRGTCTPAQPASSLRYG